MTNRLILKLSTAFAAFLCIAAAPQASSARSLPAAKAADSMAEFCSKGQAEYPQGIARMHPSFKFNICWWLEDAGIEASTFDDIAAALPEHAGPSQAIWQATFNQPAQLHLERARASEARGNNAAASVEYKKAAFYLRMNRLPKRVPTADLQATERAHALLGKPLQRIAFKTGTKEFTGYFRAPPARTGRNEKLPVLVILGGLDNLKTEMIRHSDYFMGRGFATIIVENPDTGENQLGFRPESHVMFDAVADYIKTRSDLDASRVALYGWSMGGYLGTLGGLSNDFYKAVVNVGGPSDASFGQAHCKVAPAWIVAPYTVFANMNPQTTPREAMCEYYEAFQLSRQLKMPTAVQLRKPILMVNGAHEDLVSRDEPAALAALGFNVTQLVFGDDGHTAESNMREHFEFTANWLIRRLKIEMGD
ncbi:dienelactone hydrolase [Variovorax paradoxus]|uniref:Dienelactone hydrolase n=2 Tax=Variovorax TaxID=34072 RepID=A0AAE4BXV8_VARPD|nr:MULTISPECIES: alpha/beta hydrolase [Variovorax]MDR6426364.1 dienelactone hydrolase [Variovorax paradoxus]